MEIVVNRAKDNRRGTFWCPVEHTVCQREHIETLRRKTPEGARPAMNRSIRTTELEAIDLLLAGSRHEYTEAKIEDSYKRDRFVQGFVYVRSLAAFVHEDEVERVESVADQVDAGAIISKGVRIGIGAHIGAYVELERGVKVGEGVKIGQNTVVRKGAVIGEGVKIGGHSYLGQFSRINEDVEVGSMSTLERRVGVGNNVAIGKQANIGLGTNLNSDVWLDDSVRIGRHSYVGASAGIGEMTTIGNFSHVGDRSVIGAESKLGNMVRIAKDLMLISPTYASDGEVIFESNLTNIRLGEL